MSRVIDHVFAALRDAGPIGLTAKQIAEAVSRSRGQATSQEAVSASMSNYRAANGQRPRLKLTIADRLRRWTLIDDVSDPAPLPLPVPVSRPEEPSRRAGAWPSTITAALMGDPLPGRSALDERLAGTREAA